MMTNVAPSASGFQDAFIRALFGDSHDIGREMAAVARQPGFAVYRNGVMKHAIDALQANYPAVARVVGEEWFRAAAAIYVRGSPPSSPMLVEYGASFPRFLETFEPAADIAYVADVARLDRMWTEAHIGTDDDLLDPAQVASLAPQTLSQAVLRPHACARWAWFETAPIYSIWAASREHAGNPADIDWRGEGALIVRPRDRVEWAPIDAGVCAFLDRCAEGANAGLAVQAALAANPDTDLRQLMWGLLSAGAISRIERPDENERTI